MEYLFIYALQIAEVFRVLLCLAILVLMFSGVTWCIFSASNGREEQHIAKVAKNVTITSLIILIAGMLFPTKQTLLLVGGTYYGKKAIHAVAIDKKIKKVDEIINFQLDKYLKDLKQEVNNDR